MASDRVASAASDGLALSNRLWRASKAFVLGKGSSRFSCGSGRSLSHPSTTIPRISSHSSC